MSKITAYKAFDSNLQCRGFQFEIGKTYTHKGEVKKCASGFHSCEYPLDMFNYYEPSIARFAEVEASGKIDKEENGDSKIASEKLHVKVELKIADLVNASIKYISEKCDKVKTKHSTGDRSASSATGYRSASSATGYQSASSATGDLSASSATGDRSASSATGYQSASSATGYLSASSATGDLSASSATGYRSASSATGYRSASSVKGKNAVAMNIGIQGKAMADEFGAIVLCYHDEDYNLKHIRASKVGENGIKPNVWYQLDENGEFIEQ